MKYVLVLFFAVASIQPQQVFAFGQVAEMAMIGEAWADQARQVREHRAAVEEQDLKELKEDLKLYRKGVTTERFSRRIKRVQSEKNLNERDALKVIVKKAEESSSDNDEEIGN